ncbi:MAG: GNAT family N-acetyltransferase [Bacteroidota bacterium]
MEVTIRRAEKSDCPALLSLIRELAEYERAPNEVTVTLQHFEENGFGAAPVWWGFVAETEEKVVGFALYFIRYSTWKGQCLYLEDFLVTNEYRGKGIGSLLFERVIKEAKEKGYRRMVWQVLEWNEPALTFYRKYQATLDGEWINGIIDFSS